jgi:hypothetical protein
MPFHYFALLLVSLFAKAAHGEYSNDLLPSKSLEDFLATNQDELDDFKWSHAAEIYQNHRSN